MKLNFQYRRGNYKNQRGGWSSEMRRKKSGKSRRQQQQIKTLNTNQTEWSSFAAPLWVIWSSSYHPPTNPPQSRYPQLTFTFFFSVIRPSTSVDTYARTHLCEMCVLEKIANGWSFRTGRTQLLCLPPCLEIASVRLQSFQWKGNEYSVNTYVEETGERGFSSEEEMDLFRIFLLLNSFVLYISFKILPERL